MKFLRVFSYRSGTSITSIRSFKPQLKGYRNYTNGKDLITTETLVKQDLEDLWNVAKFYSIEMEKKRELQYLRNKIMSGIFLEPSTRTFSSFAVAMYKLGGQVIKVDNETSSNKKGEALEDSIRVMDYYVGMH